MTFTIQIYREQSLLDGIIAFIESGDAIMSKEYEELKQKNEAQGEIIKSNRTGYCGHKHKN